MRQKVCSFACSLALKKKFVLNSSSWLLASWKLPWSCNSIAFTAIVGARKVITFYNENLSFVETRSENSLVLSLFVFKPLALVSHDEPLIPPCHFSLYLMKLEKGFNWGLVTMKNAKGLCLSLKRNKWNERREWDKLDEAIGFQILIFCLTWERMETLLFQTSY